jgi:predicted small lipoprotein YifL
MKRKLFTALAILALFTFTACQEDAAMEELVNDIELNQTSDPDDDDDGGIPPTGGN